MHSSGSKEELVQHLKETEEQQKRLKDQIEMCASALGSSDDPAITPTSESGRLPIPEPPSAFRTMMDEAATDAEREVWESVNDLIVERAEVVMYRAGIQALELLGMDGKMIGALKKNLKEEEAFARWLEVNNPRIAKKLMGEQMRKGKKKKRMAELAGTTSIQEEEQRTEAATMFAA